MTAHLVRSFIGLMICSISFQAAAQQAEEKEGEKKSYYLVAIQTGPLLPNQIDGVTEIQPMWNANFGFPFRKGVLELRGGASKGNGITWYNGAFSFRGEASLDDLIAIFYVGLDTHHYYPINNAPSVTTGGGHVGGGFLTLMGDNVYFRTDMKFNAAPGTALYVGFGFETRWPAGGDGDSGDK